MAGCTGGNAVMLLAAALAVFSGEVCDTAVLRPDRQVSSISKNKMAVDHYRK